MERSPHGSGRLVALGAALVAAVALLIAWTGLGSTGRALASVHPSLQFYMAVPGYAGCTTSQGDAQCYIPPGTSFNVNVTLAPLPSDITSYQGFDVKLSYTGLTSADDASTDSWPDCSTGFPATYYEPGLVNMGCSVGLPPAGPSTYTGLMATSGFTCSQSGSITLIHGDGNTDLIVDIGVGYAEGGSGETLNITCGSPPTPTVPVTPAPALGSTGSRGGPGGDGAQWLLIGSLLGLAGASVIAWSWRFARSR